MESKKQIDTRGALVFIKNLWVKYIKDNLFRVKVENQIKFPDIQKVTIENVPNIQSVRLINQKDIQRVEVVNETSLDQFVKDIAIIFENQIEKIKELKDNKDIIAKLDELKPKKGKYSAEDTIESLKSVVTAIKNQKLIVDTTKIEKGLKSLETGIKNIKLKESFKPSDLEDLLKNIYIPNPPKVVGISDEKGNRINPATEETLQNLVGLEIPPYDEQVIDLADPDDISITYKKDSATVATKSITTSGTTITITKI
jgi:hypothetical protein